ncbi:MAG: hypothetical protein JKY97_03745 [Citromicrobium sp.]|nr:hypothetical protein [Citromicrobium sp.]
MDRTDRDFGVTLFLSRIGRRDTLLGDQARTSSQRAIGVEIEGDDADQLFCIGTAGGTPLPMRLQLAGYRSGDARARTRADL